MEYMLSVLITEAKDVLWGIKIARENHLTMIEIETDFLTL